MVLRLLLRMLRMQLRLHHLLCLLCLRHFLRQLCLLCRLLVPHIYSRRGGTRGLRGPSCMHHTLRLLQLQRHRGRSRSRSSVCRGHRRRARHHLYRPGLVRHWATDVRQWHRRPHHRYGGREGGRLCWNRIAKKVCMASHLRALVRARFSGSRQCRTASEGLLLQPLYGPGPRYRAEPHRLHRLTEI